MQIAGARRAWISHTQIENSIARRVRARGLQGLLFGDCRPRALTRRSTCEIFGLQSGWIINEGPRHFKFPRKFRAERFDAECFRGVMAAIENVDAQLLSLPKGPMRPFTGNEGIDAFLCRDFQFTAGAAGYHSDSGAGDWTAWNDFDASSDGSGQPLR